MSTRFRPRSALAGFAALALSTLAGCAVVGPARVEPQALHGTWCNSEDGGATCWAWDRFTADGRFEACGQAAGDRRPFFGAGSYVLNGRRMCYVVEAASDNFWLPPGARYCTDIVAIDAQRHTYRDLDGGASHTLFRRPDGPRFCAN